MFIRCYGAFPSLIASNFSIRGVDCLLSTDSYRKVAEIPTRVDKIWVEEKAGVKAEIRVVNKSISEPRARGVAP